MSLIHHLLRTALFLPFRLCLLVGLLYSTAVQAAILVVDNTGDTDDGNYAAGQLTLREAIANANPGDTINFDAGIAGQTITLSSQLDIAKNLIINGSERSITISGNNMVRVMSITAGTVELVALTIDKGAADHGGGLGTFGSSNVTVNSLT